MVFLSKLLKSAFIFLSSESTAAKTAIIEKIPMVTPSKDKAVRSLLVRSAVVANRKLSANNRKYTNIIVAF
jgi:hypothetical protein